MVFLDCVTYNVLINVTVVQLVRLLVLDLVGLIGSIVRLIIIK